MTQTERKPIVVLASIIAASLVGCGGSGSGGDATGQLSLSISDGPIHDATEICVEFTEVEVKRSGSPPEVITEFELEQINLLDFQGMNSAPLFLNNELPAGEYQWIRLGVDAVLGGNGGSGSASEKSTGCSYGGSYVLTAQNAPINLYVPSSAQNGLKIVSGFTVAQGGVTSLTAEIDLQKSLTEPPGLAPDAVLRPAIRLVNNLEVGAVSGIVSDDLATATITDSTTQAETACEPSVYVFAQDVVPNPIGLNGDPEAEDENDPIATALVDNNDGVTDYQYTVGFLLPGLYDLAFTCDGENFDLTDVAEDVEIIAQDIATQDFPVEPIQ